MILTSMLVLIRKYPRGSIISGFWRSMNVDYTEQHKVIFQGSKTMLPI